MSLVLPGLEARLDALSAAHDGTVSIWLGDLAGHVRYERASTVAHYAASTMKLPLVIAAHRLMAAGTLAPDRPVPVHNDFASIADGSSFGLDESEDQDPATWSALGATRTVTELCESAIIESGNLATNLLLLDVVGLPAVSEVLHVVGTSPAMVVGRGIEDAKGRLSGVTNTVTARDLGLVMAAVARREPDLGGEAVLGPVEAILARQAHRDQIPAGLPTGTYTANKTGWITGVSHDVALVRPAEADPFVLAICTTIDLPQGEAADLVASIAAELWPTVGA